jgi:hypothetical protein
MLPVTVAREDVLWPIVSFKRLRHGALAALHTLMAEPSERERVALPCKNRIENAQSAQAGNLGQHAMDLQVHLIQRLLDMHDVLSRHLDQAAAVPPESAYSTDHAWRAEARSEQTDRVQVLEPLAIGDVRFASWHVLHMLCVD